MRYCKECKYGHEPDDAKFSMATHTDAVYCDHPKVADAGLAAYGPFDDGRTAAGAYMGAGFVRMFACGPDGKWWEAKE